MHTTERRWPRPITAMRRFRFLFGIDAVHGDAKLIGATIFPHNVGLGAAHDPELIRRIGQATARGGGEHRDRLDIRADRGRGARCALGPLLRKLFRITGAGGAICARDGEWVAGRDRHAAVHGAGSHAVVRQTLCRRRRHARRARPGNTVVSRKRSCATCMRRVSRRHQSRRNDRHGLLQQLEWRSRCMAIITC